MKKKKIINLIRSGVEKTAPDCWDKINKLTEKTRGENIPMSEIITESNNLKKGLAYGISMAAAVAVVVGSSALFTTAFAKSYVSIDINPSIELETNGFGKVTDVYGVNTDAKELIKELELEGEKIDDAVEEIIGEAIEEGYVSKEKENAILVSVDGKKPEKAEDIKNTVTESIDNVLNENVIKATVKTQNVNINKSIIEEAHNKGVSVGRLTVIERIMQEDDSVTLKEIRKISIEDLFEYAGAKDISLDDLLDSVEDAYEGIVEEDEDDLDEDIDDTLEDEDDDEQDDTDDDDDENNKYKTKNDNGNKNVDKDNDNNKYKTKNDNGNKNNINDDDEDDHDDDDDDEDDDDDDDDEDDDDHDDDEDDEDDDDHDDDKDDHDEDDDDDDDHDDDKDDHDEDDDDDEDKERGNSSNKGNQSSKNNNGRGQNNDEDDD